MGDDIKTTNLFRTKHLYVCCIFSGTRSIEIKETDPGSDLGVGEKYIYKIEKINDILIIQ